MDMNHCYVSNSLTYKQMMHKEFIDIFIIYCLSTFMYLAKNTHKISICNQQPYLEISIQLISVGF